MGGILAGTGVQKKWYALCEQTSRINVYIKNYQSGMSSIGLGTGVDQKMARINQRKEKYKRSTNNSHKKFICVARKLLYKLCTYRERELFEKEFEPYQNSRVYYFIILSHVKIRMNLSERENFNCNLTALLEAKVTTYNEEIRKTNNKNFINFRFEEIADIEFALKALTLYLDNKVQEAIEVIYKKEKGFVLKKQQFQMALSIVGELEERLRSYPEGELFPYFNQKPKKVEMAKEKSSGTGGRGKKDEDEEWVQERIHRQSLRHTSRRQRRREQYYQNRNQSQAEKTPLLFLENSFPINPHFYSVLFSYPDPQDHQSYTSFAQNYSHNSIFNPFKPFQKQENYQVPQPYLDIEEESLQKPRLEMKIKSEGVQPYPYYLLPNKELFFDYSFNKKQLLPPRSTGDTVKKLEEDIDYSLQI